MTIHYVLCIIYLITEVSYHFWMEFHENCRNRVNNSIHASQDLYFCPFDVYLQYIRRWNFLQFIPATNINHYGFSIVACQ